MGEESSMNKIYKVVWSKVKHCYVVTSELAKRQTKGCGARSLRMAAVSLGVAAALIGGVSTPVAEAGKTVTSITYDYSNAYIFQTSPKSLAVNQAAISDSGITGNKYVYGNVRFGDSQTTTNVYYTIENGQAVRHADATVFYGAPYASVLAVNPFNDTTAITHDTYSTLGEYVKASAAAQEDVSGYSVTLTGKTLVDVAGALSWGGNVSGNSVVISGGEANTAYGGTTSTGSATNNTVTIGSGTSKADNVYGGYSSGYPASGDASTNHVNINGGTVTYNLWGGYSVAGNANSNEVTVNSGSVGSELYGGMSGNGNANNNTVTVNGSVGSNLYGGSGKTGASKNTVTISGGTINSRVYGGYVDEGVAGGSNADEGNKVIINDGEVKRDVHGGYSDKGNVTNNSVSLNKGSIYRMYGGKTDKGDAINNKVIIEDGTVNFYYDTVTGGYSHDGNATDNIVTINGGNLVINDGVNIKAGFSSGKDNNAKNNKVIISNGTIGSDAGSESESSSIVGGYGSGGNATDNAVTISGGKFASRNAFKLYSGKSYTAPLISTAGETFAATSTANNNTLDISGGTYSNNVEVYGGWTNAQPTSLSGTAIATVTADKNTVTIGGGAYSGNADIYGGYVYSSPTASGSEATATAEGTASNNTVEISGGTFSGKVNVYGGYGKSTTAGTGTLTVKTTIINNNVFIKKGTLNGDVYGGISSSTGTNNVEGNSVSIGKDATVSGKVYGGKIDYDKSGTVTNNSVTMSGGTVDSLYGGLSLQAHGTGAVSDNTVEMKGGKLSGYGEIVGGYSRENWTTEDPTKVDVKNNVVKITGDVDFKTNVVGGWAQGSGLVQNNRVEFSANNVDHFGEGEFTATVTGGKGGAGGATDNKVIFSKGMVYSVTGGSSNGSTATLKGDVLRNTVEMSGGTVYGRVTGGSSSSGKAEYNEVTISSGSIGRSDSDGTNAEISGGRSTPTVITFSTGSTATSSGTACHNKVTINDGTFTGVDIHGGYMYAMAAAVAADTTATVTGTVDTNTVTISGGTFSGSVNVYGGYGKATADAADTATATATVTVTNNKVLIESGTLSGSVYGGYIASGTGDVKGNKVEITGEGKISKTVYGGYSNIGTAENNSVTVSGSSQVNSTVYGGHSENGGKAIGNTVTLGESAKVMNGITAGWSRTSDAENNTVTVNNGTVSGYIFGGIATGTAKDNHIIVNNGTVSYLEGGSAAGSATGNTVEVNGGKVNDTIRGGNSDAGTVSGNIVTINGGTVNNGIMGGYTNDGTVTGNTVTIGGGTVNGKIHGGFKYGGAANDNIVNLKGVADLSGASLYGACTADSTGNELHVGGVKGGTDSKDTIFASGTNNKVIRVENFNTVALHSVNWSTSAAALEATSMTNIGTLDITNLKFYEGGSEKSSFTEGESMALLKSAESDLSGVKLTYDATHKDITITEAGVILGGGATEKTEETGVNGVKLTQIVSEKVSLPDKNTIAYSCDVGEVKKVTFNAGTPITFADGGLARDLTGKTFAVTNTVDADGLTFADSSEAIAKGASMSLVANATGITTTVDNNTGKTVAIKDYEDAQKIKYSATATGDVTSAGGAVKYTVSSVTLNNVDLAGWTGTASDLTVGDTSGWTGAGVAVSGSFTEPEVAANSSQDILTSAVAGLFTDGAIDDAIKYKEGVTFNDDEASGVTLSGTQSKGVKADDGGKKLVYEVGAKNVTDITLGNMTVGTPRDMNTDYNFAGVTKIDASALDFDKPENVNADMNLVTNAAGIPTGMDATDGKDHIQSFDKTADNNTVLTATLKGTVTTGTNVVKYAYGGTELAKVDLKDWNGSEATFDATGWTKGASAAVETAGLSVTVDPGVEKTVLTVSGVDLTDITVNGEAYQWKNGGDSIAETSAENGVKITAGETTGGGIKGDGNKIIYKGSSKTVTGLEVTSVDFVKDGVAREFKNDYDLTNAAIAAASNISVSNTAAMNAGDTMIILDATDAIKVAGQEKQTLQNFATINAGAAVEFADQIEGKALTLSGTHQDTLEQNADKNRILYKVGDKNVNKATFTGEVAWNDCEAYYTNDATKHKFTGAVDVDATNLIVTGTTDKALKNGDTMTLLSAEGMTEGTVTPQSDANKTASKITVNYNDTASGITLGAEATGGVNAVTDAVNYEVNEVTLKTVDLSGWNGTAADLTAGDTSGWTAEDGSVTVATGSFAAPEVAVGSSKTILTAGGAFFSDDNISGKNKYQESSFKESDKGIKFAGTQEKGVKADGTNLVYAAGTKNVTTATMTGEVAWKDGGVYYKNTKYTFTDASKTDISGVRFTAGTDPLAEGNKKSMTLISGNVAGKVKEGGAPAFAVALENTKLEATAEGEATINNGDLQYTVTGVTLDKVEVIGVGDDAVPETWNVADDVKIDTDSMKVPSDVEAGEEKIILKSNGKRKFSDADISEGSNKYGQNPDRKFTKTDEVQRAVTIKGTQDKGVKTDMEGNVVYVVGKKEVSAVNLGAVKWAAGAALLKADSKDYDYSKAALTDNLTVTYDKPENVAANESMTLLKANGTLKDMAAAEKKHAYRFNPVSGVTVDAAITGRLASKDGTVTYTAAENKAGKLTFGDVEWKDGGALITRPSNIIFAGADVDTAKIKFTNVIYLDADRQMTLVSDFGKSVGTITGNKYMVGTAFEGEGTAALRNGDLIFRTKTGAGVSEQTHKAVMGTEATMALLASGGEHVGNVVDGLGEKSNAGRDGVSTAASLGGGASRYETGSYVNTRTWNAAVGVGAAKETDKGTLQYGIFGEYGKGNYTLHSNAGRSDGDAHYAGGGILAKWTNRHDVYAEVSFRLGRMSDSAEDLLRDGAGNAYGYDIHANYYGAHAGVGKVFHYKGGKSLDVYGKFFYTKRDGAEFDAVQRYDLDSVTSSVLRIGARYGTSDKRWNWYGGLAYEYEFDGGATGKVNGTAIRSASVKGSSVRGELGMRMDATKTNPWQTDISLYGYAGKHRGFGGKVNVAYTF